MVIFYASERIDTEHTKKYSIFKHNEGKLNHREGFKKSLSVLQNR